MGTAVLIMQAVIIGTWETGSVGHMGPGPPLELEDVVGHHIQEELKCPLLGACSEQLMLSPLCTHTGDPAWPEGPEDKGLRWEGGFQWAVATGLGLHLETEPPLLSSSGAPGGSGHIFLTEGRWTPSSCSRAQQPPLVPKFCVPSDFLCLPKLGAPSAAAQPTSSSREQSASPIVTGASHTTPQGETSDRNQLPPH